MKEWGWLANAMMTSVPMVHRIYAEEAETARSFREVFET